MPEERIQKLLAEAGVASRRGSEALIAAGRVRVDGRIARLGDRADATTARLEVDGRPVGVGVAKAYLVLHKPAGVTSTTRDRHAATTVLDLVPTTLVPDGTRLYPVGRLDRDSEGLLLLTNDGEWAERILHPRFGVEREYAVGLATPLTADQAAVLEAGIELEEGVARLARPLRRIGRAEVAMIGSTLDPPPDPNLAWYRATLRQGWKRQLRRMFGAVDAPIARLVRIAIGSVRLGDLPAGSVRRLRQAEVDGTGGVRPGRSREGRSPESRSREGRSGACRGDYPRRR